MLQRMMYQKDKPNTRARWFLNSAVEKIHHYRIDTEQFNVILDSVPPGLVCSEPVVYLTITASADAVTVTTLVPTSLSMPFFYRTAMWVNLTTMSMCTPQPQFWEALIPKWNKSRCWGGENRESKFVEARNRSQPMSLVPMLVEWRRGGPEDCRGVLLLGSLERKC